MAGPLTVTGLFEAQHNRLGLVWLAGRSGAGRALPPVSDREQALVACSDGAPAGAIRILDGGQIDGLQAREGISRAAEYRLLFSGRRPAVIIAQGAVAPGEMIDYAERSATPLFSATLPADQLQRRLQQYIADTVAGKTVLHGVFLEVLGAGVLITGSSGIGKSELALELISRGHRLIADDVTEFRRTEPATLQGTCPETLRDFLEVRGLGILNIRAMFGDSAIKRSKNLRLIICLKQFGSAGLRAIDRLRGSQQTRALLDVDVPQVTLPVAPGRNLAVLVEAAVRNHVLALRGYDAPEDFARKQQQHMLQGE